MEKILLVADKNPYSIQSDLTVLPGGAIYLEPGVEIRFAPDTALVVAGGAFMAYGQSSRPILLGSKTAGSEPGAWSGIFLDGAGRSTLSHVVIAGAETGLSITDSAPLIKAVTVKGSSQAGLHLKDRARPNITCSTFLSNEGQGGMVIEGEGVSPVIRNNVFRDNSPFQVQSYTPLRIDLSNNFWGRPEPPPDWFLGNVVWQPALSVPTDFCSK
jgi:hypothetical protein